MNLPQCLICHSHREPLLELARSRKKQWLCSANDCALKYYQKIDWLKTDKPLKKGRPKLHNYTSEIERKAHYRIKKRDKNKPINYFKKKHMRMKKNELKLNSH